MEVPLGFCSHFPILDFDDGLLLHPQDGNTQRVGDISFRNFVDRVLIFCNASYLRKFRLKCSKCDTVHVNAWIFATLRFGVRELDLCITMKQSFKLTYHLFAFQQLVFLKLGKKFVLHVPISVCFPSLKTLHLDSIEFLDDDSTHKLFSSCPVLEELIVEDCGFKNIWIFSVSAPALKSLTIESSLDENDDYNTGFCEYKIFVDAPALEFLRVIDFVAMGYSFKNFQCLLDAFIDVTVGRGEREDIDKCELELLRGISNSKALFLSCYSLEGFAFLNELNLPIFNNLTHLALEVSKYCGQLVPILLENSPNLKILTLDLQAPVGEFKWEPPPEVPECLLLNLKEVVIDGFSRQENVLKLIKYLLENARVLNKVSRPPRSNVEDVKVDKSLFSLLLMNWK